MGSVDRFRQAEEDLLSIAEFIARDNPSVAVRWMDDIEAVLVRIAQQPYMGEAVNHIRPGLRRVTHGNYAIYYEPRDAGILLVRILHGTRKIEDLFRP
jgi:toxin ParE1/3/4